MDIVRRRGTLIRTRKALDKGKLTLGFMGGSITDGRTEWNWPDPVCAWFSERFPKARLTVENCAIGATGSESAVFRAERAIISRNCDIVFVEFAVNDWWVESDRRMRTREALLRKLLKEERDVVIVYTYAQYMYPDMINEKMPHSIAEFEQLAKHYSISSVWMGLHALNQVKQGQLRFEAWLPDALHPQYRGSLAYAESVIQFLKGELSGKKRVCTTLSGKNRPAPLNVNNWERAVSLSFSEVTLHGAWLLKRWNKYGFLEQVLHTSAIGASLEFSFNGRGLSLGFDFGKNSAEFRYRIDGGEWKVSNRDRPDWVGADGWYQFYCVTDDLPNGRHHFEMEVIHGNHAGDPTVNARYSGTQINLGLIGIIA
jgi:hypothetical protein